MTRILFFKKPPPAEKRQLLDLLHLLQQRERDAIADQAAYLARKDRPLVVSAREVTPARRAGGRR